MPRIEDGGGKNGFATVSNNQRLDVSARTASRQYYESRDEEQVFTCISEDPTALAGEEIAYLKNTSTDKDIIIDKVTISAVAASKWRIKFVTNALVVAGTIIIPINMNRTSSKQASAECRGVGAVTNLVDAGDITVIRVEALSHDEIDFGEAVRLGQGDAIAIECETDSAAEIVCSFHFDSE